MKSKEKTTEAREAIVTEYLLGNTSLRQVGSSHGVDFRSLHSWISIYQGKKMPGKKPKLISERNSTDLEPADVRQLREELSKSKLHVELLNAILDKAESQLKISIRKKSGTKQ